MATGTRQDQASDKLNGLKLKLQGQLESARKKLDQMKQEIAAAREQDQQALTAKRDEIHQRVEGQEERFQELRDNLQDWQREKTTHTKEAIASWRQRLEMDKLSRRADRAEESAVNALYIAMLDADAAEEAVLDAISARIDVDAATPS